MNHTDFIHLRYLACSSNRLNRDDINSLIVDIIKTENSSDAFSKVVIEITTFNLSKTGDRLQNGWSDSILREYLW